MVRTTNRGPAAHRGPLTRGMGRGLMRGGISKPFMPGIVPPLRRPLRGPGPLRRPIGPGAMMMSTMRPRHLFTSQFESDSEFSVRGNSRGRGLPRPLMSCPEDLGFPGPPVMETHLSNRGKPGLPFRGRGRGLLSLSEPRPLFPEDEMDEEYMIPPPHMMHDPSMFPPPRGRGMPPPLMRGRGMMPPMRGRGMPPHLMRGIHPPMRGMRPFRGMPPPMRGMPPFRGMGPMRGVPPFRGIANMRGRGPMRGRRGAPSNKAISQTASSDKSQPKSVTHPWVTESMRNEIKKKHKLYAKFKRTSNPADHTAYKEQRNKVIAMLREAKLEYITSHPDDEISKQLTEATAAKKLKKEQEKAEAKDDNGSDGGESDVDLGDEEEPDEDLEDEGDEKDKMLVSENGGDEGNDNWEAIEKLLDESSVVEDESTS